MHTHAHTCTHTHTYTHCQRANEKKYVTQRAKGVAVSCLSYPERKYFIVVVKYLLLFFINSQVKSIQLSSLFVFIIISLITSRFGTNLHQTLER